VPTGAAFEIVGRSRPFEVVSPGFEQVVDAPRTLAALHISGDSPVAPFAAVEAAVAPAETSRVAVGLVTAQGDGVLVDLHRERSQVRIVVVEAGRERVLRRRRQPNPPVQLGLVLCENQVTALVDDGRGWQAMTTEATKTARIVDLRDPATLARHSYAWGPVGNGTGAGTSMGPVRAGPFGMTGVRDPHLVQSADGTPLVRDGQLYLTMTCAGMGFFRQAHWGVFTLDLSAPDRVVQVGHLFSRRDGRVLGDHAGQLVVDGDTVRLAVSSWGDFDPATGLHVRHAECGLDVLHGVHVVDTEPLAMPTRHSAWDPAATVIDDRWHVAFVESPSQEPFDFRPALAVGPPGGGWGEGLERVGADTSLDQCEGPILARVEDEWRLLASDGRGRRYPVYDLEMRPVGTLPAPYPSNIPHPQVVPLPPGSASATELLVTFDGTPWSRRVLGYGTHGDFIVMAR
jgi:hypothetical protein